jgi:hypothetical protein
LKKKQGVLKQGVRVIRVISRKEQKLFEPIAAYGCRFGEQTKVAFIIVCPYQQADVSHTNFFLLQRENPIVSLQTNCAHMFQIHGDSTTERVGDSFFSAFGT